MRVIFVGNPGTGKSTLLNGLLGDKEAQFKSGVSYGAGLTSVLQWVRDKKTKYWYGDTPGLSDVNLRKIAAAEITKALKTGKDDYKIVFIITEEAGRVRPIDITTITTVLRAIVDGGAVTSPQYGIIVNKMTKKKIKKLSEDDNALRAFSACLQCDYPTGYVHFYGFKEELEDEDDMVHAVTTELSQFLNEIPSMKIDPNEVQDVKVHDYEKEMEKLETEMKNIVKDKELQEKKHKEDSIRLEKSFTAKITESEKKRTQMSKDIQRNKEMQEAKDAEYANELYMINQKRESDRILAIKDKEIFENEKKRMIVAAEKAKKESRNEAAEIRRQVELKEVQYKNDLKVVQMQQAASDREAAKAKEKYEEDNKRNLEERNRLKAESEENATQLRGMNERSSNNSSGGPLEMIAGAIGKGFGNFLGIG